MKAVRIHNHGGSEVLKVDNLDIPKCTENYILVNVKACSLNHLDIWVREGLPGLPIKLPLIIESLAVLIVSVDTTFPLIFPYTIKFAETLISPLISILGSRIDPNVFDCLSD